MSDRTALTEALVSWFLSVRRDLPWRRTRDPYHIWVSEIMLQQTQVATVIPYFERFVGLFPTPSALASAPTEQVLKAWEGLGYYSRARNLQAGALRVVSEHGGRVPADWEAVRALPGVGDYTAGAILSIAFGTAVPAVDGNVLRVLSRVFLVEGDVTKPATKREITALAASLLPKGPRKGPEGSGPLQAPLPKGPRKGPEGSEPFQVPLPSDRPGDLNEALMELGATVCTPKSPRCDTCPVSAHCAARAANRQHSLPVKAKKAAPKPVTLAVALVERDGRVLLMPRPEGGIWGGLWAFPSTEVPAGVEAAHALGLALLAIGVEATVGPLTQTLAHTLTHRQLHMPVHAAAWVAGDIAGAGAWVRPDDLGRYPLPVPMQKIARSLDPGPLFRLRCEAP